MQKEKPSFQVIPNWSRIDWNESKKMSVAVDQKPDSFPLAE
jgi:hypothetical protein